MWAAPQCKEQQESPVALAGLRGFPDVTDHLEDRYFGHFISAGGHFLFLENCSVELQNASGYEPTTILCLEICIPGKNT